MTTPRTTTVAAAIAKPSGPELPGTERPPYVASPDRYEVIDYRRTGVSGLQLPAISLGLWHNFGDTRPTPSTTSKRRSATARARCASSRSWAG